VKASSIVDEAFFVDTESPRPRTRVFHPIFGQAQVFGKKLGFSADLSNDAWRAASEQ